MKKLKKTGLHLISRILSTSRKKLRKKAQSLNNAKIRFLLPEWRIPWKMWFHWTKKQLPFQSVSEKISRKWFPLTEIRFFKKYRPPSNCNNASQKCEWENIVITKQKVGCHWLQQRIRFKYISKRQKMCFKCNGYLRYWNKEVSAGQKISFHEPEWRICLKNDFSPGREMPEK